MKRVTTPIPSPLLDELYTLPNQAGLRSIINKTCVGYIFSNQPNRYVFLKTTGPYSYFAGELDGNDLTEFVNFLKTFPAIKLVCDERHHTSLCLKGMRLIPRIELIKNSTTINIDISPQITIKKITTSDFGEKCPWFDFITGLYGSREIFFKEGFGFTVCEGDTLLSSSYAASFSCCIFQYFA